MTTCCICNTTGKNLVNIYQDYIKSSSTLIIEVILECMQGMEYTLQEDEICIKCLDIVSQYFKTNQLALKIKNEIINRLYKPIEFNEEIIIKAEQNNGDITYVQLGEPITHSNENNKSFSEDTCDGQISDNELIKSDELKNDMLMEEECIDPEDYDIEFLPEDEYSCDEDLSLTKENKVTQQVKTSETHCSECNQFFTNQRDYRSHYKKNHFSGYICDQCGKTLHSYSGFFAHKQNHNPVKPYECPDCGERFRHKIQLKYHMAWHTGEKPFQCEICSKQFVHRVALHKHKQIHDNSNRRYECDVCGSKFRTSAHLRRHKMTHTGAKPHCCHICGKCFAQAYNMRVHVKEHQKPGSTRQRRFKCPRCTCTFTNKKNFENHLHQNDCVSGE